MPSSTFRCCVPSCKTSGARSNSFCQLNELHPQKAALLPIQKYYSEGKKFICKDHFNQARLSKSDEEYKPECMFFLECRDVMPETFGDFGVSPDRNDFIVTLVSFKQQYAQRLTDYMSKWNFAEYEKFILFFLLEGSDIPKIRFSIQIDDQLLVRVSLDGRLMDPLDLTGFIPVSGRITRWSQLEKMLVYYAQKKISLERITSIKLNPLPGRF